MKISKVDHRRTAVAKKGGKGNATGILYKPPGGSNENNKVVIDELVNGKPRYSVINENINYLYKIKDGLSEQEMVELKEKDRIKKEIVNIFEDYQEAIINTEAISSETHGVNESKFPKGKIISAMQDGENDKRTQAVIDDIVGACIKANLRRKIKDKYNKECVYYVPDTIKKLMIRACGLNDDKFTDEEKKEFSYVLSFLITDNTKQTVLDGYWKSFTAERLGQSITNQKLKVKVEEWQDDVIGEGYRIRPIYDNGNKNNELLNFLNSFAVSDKNERKKILSELKKLIVYFVCGIDIGDKDIDVWSFKDFNIDENTNFLDKDDHEILKGCLDEDDIIKRRKMIQDLNIAIKEKISERYTDTKKAKGKGKVYWLDKISNAIERQLKNPSKWSVRRFKNLELCKYVWRYLQSLLANKYIELGKGVYHFAMPNLYSLIENADNEGEIVLGEVINEQFKGGITSFDYERVKAEETLDRSIALAATFAGSAFSNSIINKNNLKDEDRKDDVLYLKWEDFTNISEKSLIRNDALMRVFRYFGGISKWPEVNEKNRGAILSVIQTCIKDIRNGTYHYTAYIDRRNEIKESSWIRRIFAKEYGKINEIYLNKYVANNLNLFYEANDLIKLMNIIYAKPVQRAAYVPSFNSVVKKNSINKILQELIGEDNYNKISENGMVLKAYSSAIYFLLKEMYYNSFLQQDNLKKDFIEYSKKYKEEDESQVIQQQHEKAREKFNDRLNKVNDLEHDFASLCQLIMTDYNMQNQNKSDKEKGNEIYKHYHLLLHKTIKELFIKHIKDNDKFKFIKEPIIPNELENDVINNELINLKDNFKPKMFEDLKNLLEFDNPKLFDWYIMSRFLTAKQLNFLIGDFRSYIQFINEIDERSKDLENTSDSTTKEKINNYNEIIKILEFSMLFTGQVSNEASDYFASKDDFAKHVSMFVDFNGITFDELRRFEEGIEIEYGFQSENFSSIYTDNKNAIINRSIAYSDMYGNVEIIEKALKDKRITKDDIIKYRNLCKQLKNKKTFTKTKYNNENEIRELRKFQNLKNRIELYDISTFTDIINDYMAQLVSWAYMRERDLMYFQLGIHYTRTFPDNKELINNEKMINKKDSFKYKNLNVKAGAILYEIVSLYSYPLPMFEIEDGVAKTLLGTNGMGTQGKKEDWFKKVYGEELYGLGLELFEDCGRHEEFLKFRNNIAHMHYISKPDASIMKLMSKVYNGFLFYSLNFTKSVSFIFGNILASYFVTPYTNMRHQNNNGEEFELYLTNTKKNDKGEYVNYLDSKDLTYKYEFIGKNGTSNKEVEVPARDSRFLEEIKLLLEYEEK